MKNSTADETVTVRLPKGAADKVRAATGQPFSRIVRWMVIALLEKHANDHKLNDGRAEVADLVNNTQIGGSNG